MIILSQHEVVRCDSCFFFSQDLFSFDVVSQCGCLDDSSVVGRCAKLVIVYGVDKSKQYYVICNTK